MRAKLFSRALRKYQTLNKSQMSQSSNVLVVRRNYTSSDVGDVYVAIMREY